MKIWVRIDAILQELLWLQCQNVPNSSFNGPNDLEDEGQGQPFSIGFLRASATPGVKISFGNNFSKSNVFYS